MPRRTIRILPPATQEAREAYLWYRERSRSAAAEFQAAVKATIKRVHERPQGCTPHILGTRAVLCNQFPFLVIFREIADTIEIVAIAHTSRRSDYWTKRL